MALIKLAKVLREITDEFVADCGSDFEINNGLCEEWAEEVFYRLEKSSHKVEVWATPYFFADTTHIFVRIDGKFYDAESLDGVDDHNNLPIFKKLIRKGCRRQPVWCENSNHDMPIESIRDASKKLKSEIREEQIDAGVDPARALKV